MLLFTISILLSLHIFVRSGRSALNDGCAKTRLHSANACDVAYKVEKKQRSPLFKVGGRRFVNTRSLTIQVSAKNKTEECKLYFNVASIFKNQLKKSVFTIHDVRFHCLSPARLSFCRPGNFTANDRVMYLRLKYQCRVSAADLAVWGRALDLRVLYLWNQVVLEDRGETKADLQGLFNIGSLVLNDLKNRTMPRMFLTFVWGKMAEVQFSKMRLGAKTLRTLKKTMPYLQSLELSRNNLRVLPDFPWCKRGLELPRNLSRTTLLNDHYSEGATISPRVYRRFFMVEFNPGLRDLKRPSGNVDKISLRGNQLRSINSTIFNEVIGLKIVDLSENQLSHIPARIFEKTSDLLSINLNKNNLTSLDGRVFERLENLRRLNVKNNFIHTLQNNFLSDKLQKLQSIDFENNMLRVVEPRAIPRGVFDALKKINLRQNKLRDVPQFGLYVRNLDTFDLSDNEIDFAGFVRMIDELYRHDFLFLHTDTGSSIDTTSTRDLTTNSPNKKIFNLQRNAIERFDLNKFGKIRLEKLESVLKTFTIILKGNPLHCDCKTRELQSWIRYWTKTVKGITEKDFESWICYTPVALRGKRISYVHPNQLLCEKRNCSKCPTRCTCYHHGYPGSATLVNCRGRNLTTVPEELPDGMLILNIQYNQIENLTLSKDLENVTVIYASHNEIERVILDDSQIKLKELYLYSNKLTTLPKRFQNLTLSRINIQNNYFTCDCNNRWMKNWLKRKREIFVGGAKSVGCSSGGRNQGKPLVLVEDKDFVCVEKVDTTAHAHESIAAISSYVVAGFLALIMITAAVLYRFRKELKLILYTRFNWHPFDRVDDSDPSKIYDAFVSFNVRDKVWVEENLQDKLEKGNPPYKLCVHYRDFIPGAPIAETILESVKKSRRMIMVLSRNFIQSEWCMLEFRAAHLRVLKGRANYLIVVLFDDVDVDSLDDELKLYLKTNTYLSVESKWFWQQLKYALPQKKLETRDEGISNEGIEFVARHPGLA